MAVLDVVVDAVLIGWRLPDWPINPSAERMLAAQNPAVLQQIPHQFFGDSAGQIQTAQQVQQQVNAMVCLCWLHSALFLTVLCTLCGMQEDAFCSQTSFLRSGGCIQFCSL
jgi:hypothetical protein